MKGITIGGRNLKFFIENRPVSYISGRNLKFFIKFRPLIYEIMVRECFLEANSRIAQYTIHTAYNTQQ